MHQTGLLRGNALPQRLAIVFLSLSDGASKCFFYKEVGSEARSSDLCGLRMRDVRKGTEVVMSHIDALGDLEKFYEQWQVIFDNYDAVFFGIDWWSGNALQRPSWSR